MKTVPHKSQRALIGKNLRNLRESRGLSQTTLGHALGVSFQQIQKYERGDSTLPAFRLYALSHFLDVPYDALFAGIDDHITPAPPPPAALHPAIMARAWKIQRCCRAAEQTKLLKIIDIMTG